MKEILSRLNEFEYIETIIFPEDIIVNVRNKTKDWDLVHERELLVF